MMEASIYSREVGMEEVQSPGPKRGSPNILTFHRDLPATQEEAIQKLGEALSDPRDLRNDVELSVSLGIPQKTIEKLRTDPSFMEPVRSAFRRRLSSVEIDVIKHILVQSKEGSLGASRTFLELSGSLAGKGTVVNIHGSSPASAQQDWVTNLSDADLDREIHRLLMETAPDEVVYDSGHVIPADHYDVLGDTDDSVSGVGRDDDESEEREVSTSHVTEAKENG